MSQRPSLPASGELSAVGTPWRVLVLSSSLVLLLCLLGGWLYLRTTSNSSDPGAQRQSVLERDFPEPEFSDQATADQLLALADKQVELLLQEWSDSSQVLDIKANRDFQLSDTEEAREAWTKALEFNPNDADALFGLANLAFERGDYAESARICELLQRAHPGNPRVPLLLADSYLHAAQPETAVFTLEQHITSEPASVQAWQMLGNAHLNLRNYDKAISCFERSLQFAPDSKDAHYGLGQAYVRKGRTEEAKQAMERFQELAKASSDESATSAQTFVDRAYAAHIAAQVYVDGAILYQEKGDFEKAEEWLLRALLLQPDVTAWLRELKSLYLGQGKNAEAADITLRLTELEPEQLDHWLTLGGLYAELNQPTKAIAALRQAIEINPDDPRCINAKHVIEQIEQQP